MRIIRLIKSFLFIKVPEKYKKEFKIETDTYNVAKMKIFTIVLIAFGLIMILASVLMKKEDFFIKPDIYYLYMYIAIVLVMPVFLFIFIRLEKNKSKNVTLIGATEILFILFALVWCGGISLLDQQTIGQIIVYSMAIIVVAGVPLFRPVTLLSVYAATQALFICCLAFMNETGKIPFSDTLNSSLFIVAASVIARMRYKSWVDGLMNKKTIQEKNDELMKVNQELEILSRTDSLTGIFNRSVFDRALQAEWNRCKRNGIPLSMIMIDLDFFKAFNDNYGHPAGDTCIQQVAGVLWQCGRRSSDIVSRYGGDEFAVILPHLDGKEAFALAELYKKKVEELAIPHEYSSVANYVTISLGLYTIVPSDASSLEELIRITDRALYQAKKNRNMIAAE